ncbi:UTP--glucose-1-phosphate uridylyltransferase GalU [Hazenella coriacea]|uniref:UTP--glucose-1-phosphate uridylyltransferase n=1 Tax=Hazenella coriacea TaxID=1179467 RepID=A0A4R3LEL5_9BACL|nr:UTP--glucose-1-phosphate uridylyltransferase GalU [Hazenella coriacea]TCS95896.1 UDP-glucose pyrophosphorylase [Hazenella coriacea]
MMNVRKAVIPAAGLGTRFLPATKALPKEMLPIMDRPVIQFIVEEAIQSGIEDILIITGRNKRPIEDHFDKSLELEVALEQRQKFDLLEKMERISQVRIHYIRQKEPRGLGDAVLQARSFIGEEPFALLLGDDIVEVTDPMPPCTQQLIEQYQKTGSPVIGVQPVKEDEVSQYGVIQPECLDVKTGDMVSIIDLVEKPLPTEAPSQLAIMGRYILDPTIFPILEQTPPGWGGEIQLTDALRTYIQQKNQMMAYRFAGTRYDVGTPLGFLKANLVFALRHPTYRSATLQLLEQVREDEPL